MKQAAIICASGIGDGLMMMVAANALAQKGYTTTVYHSLLHELKEWFPYAQFKKHLELEDYIKELQQYERIVLQNDNSARAKCIIDAFHETRSLELNILYPSYEAHKHHPLRESDNVFNGQKPMVQNIAHAMRKLLNDETIVASNGIVVPKKLTPKKYKKRVIIHPTSTTPTRTWSEQKFVELALILRALGYEPVLAVAPHEREHWKQYESMDIEVPLFPTLSELAAYVYESAYMIGNESGISHLASNLQLPTLVIAGNAKRIQLWRPGWREGDVITPPSWVINIKGLRLREEKWQKFISTRAVLKNFQKMVK